MTNNAGDMWMVAGERSVCDTSAGEVYLQSSPGRGQSLEQYQQKCVDEFICLLLVCVVYLYFFFSYYELIYFYLI